jgi:hypothetical protein
MVTFGVEGVDRVVITWPGGRCSGVVGGSSTEDVVTALTTAAGGGYLWVVPDGGLAIGPARLSWFDLGGQGGLGEALRALVSSAPPRIVRTGIGASVTPAGGAKLFVEGDDGSRPLWFAEAYDVAGAMRARDGLVETLRAGGTPFVVTSGCLYCLDVLSAKDAGWTGDIRNVTGRVASFCGAFALFELVRALADCRGVVEVRKEFVPWARGEVSSRYEREVVVGAPLGSKGGPLAV